MVVVLVTVKELVPLNVISDIVFPLSMVRAPMLFAGETSSVILCPF